MRTISFFRLCGISVLLISQCEIHWGATALTENRCTGKTFSTGLCNSSTLIRIDGAVLHAFHWFSRSGRKCEHHRSDCQSTLEYQDEGEFNRLIAACDDKSACDDYVVKGNYLFACGYSDFLAMHYRCIPQDQGNSSMPGTRDEVNDSPADPLGTWIGVSVGVLTCLVVFGVILKTYWNKRTQTYNSMPIIGRSSSHQKNNVQTNTGADVDEDTATKSATLMLNTQHEPEHNLRVTSAEYTQLVDNIKYEDFKM